eukprot:5594760-Pyramimonas_sp.AAC.1
MPSYAVLRDRTQVGIQLTFMSPQPLKRLLHKSALRLLEVPVADRLGLSWGRACFAIVKARAKSTKFTPLEQGAIRRLACSGP